MSAVDEKADRNLRSATVFRRRHQPFVSYCDGASKRPPEGLLGTSLELSVSSELTHPAWASQTGGPAVLGLESSAGTTTQQSVSAIVLVTVLLETKYLTRSK